MINAKEEFIDEIGSRTVRCACITIGDWSTKKGTILLKCGYSESDFERFKTDLDFEYDHGWGSQFLDGTIWYTDGTWSERGEYDGSEWWEHRECPEIPLELENENHG